MPRSRFENQDLQIAASGRRGGAGAGHRREQMGSRRRSGTAARDIEEQVRSSCHKWPALPVVAMSGLPGAASTSSCRRSCDSRRIWNTAFRQRSSTAGSRADGPASAAGAGRSTDQAPLHDPGQCTATVLRAVRVKCAALPDSYVRYLVNGLRDAFELWGTPIRVHLRQPKNPYRAQTLIACASAPRRRRVACPTRWRIQWPMLARLTYRTIRPDCRDDRPDRSASPTPPANRFNLPNSGYQYFTDVNVEGAAAFRRGSTRIRAALR